MCTQRETAETHYQKQPISKPRDLLRHATADPTVLEREDNCIIFRNLSSAKPLFIIYIFKFKKLNLTQLLAKRGLEAMDLSRRNSKDTGIDTFLSGLSKGIIMDLNRNKRKNGARDHEPSDFSQQSILSAMDRFVQAVNNMDDTIMVPSRLLDMSHRSDHTNPGENSSNDLPPDLKNTDLFSFYNMLNSVKTELIWGGGKGNSRIADECVSSDGKISLARRMSTISIQSCSDSDVESESSSEFDSGLEFDEHSLRIANAFRQHLSGLFHSLHQLTESANYLASRYQEEVGGSS